MTSHGSYYVDVRIFKEALLPKENNQGTATSAANLEWAFAGTSHTQPLPSSKDGEEKEWQSTWDHWIDSKTHTPVPDSGEMYLQPNGDVLERGVQKHPITGLECVYEELWSDDPVRATGDDSERICTVVKAENLELQTKGLVVRAGQYCQGMMEVGDDLTVERWRHMKGNTHTEGHWVSTMRIGTGLLPCEGILSTGKMEIGDVVEEARRRPSSGKSVRKMNTSASIIGAWTAV